MNLSEATTKSEWETPPDLLEIIRKALEIEKFSYDPATSLRNPTGAALFSTAETDGLSIDWNDPLCGRYLWLNPPWGKKSPIRPWINKFVTYNGTGTLLAPANTGAQWFHHLVFNSSGDHLLFFKGRINYVDPATGSLTKGCPFDSFLLLRNWSPRQVENLWKQYLGRILPIPLKP